MVGKANDGEAWWRLRGPNSGWEASVLDWFGGWKILGHTKNLKTFWLKIFSIENIYKKNKEDAILGSIYYTLPKMN